MIYYIQHIIISVVVLHLWHIVPDIVIQIVREDHHFMLVYSTVIYSTALLFWDLQVTI